MDSASSSSSPFLITRLSSHFVIAVTIIILQVLSFTSLPSLYSSYSQDLSSTSSLLVYSSSPQEFPSLVEPPAAQSDANSSNSSPPTTPFLLLLLVLAILLLSLEVFIPPFQSGIEVYFPEAIFSFLSRSFLSFQPANSSSLVRQGGGDSSIPRLFTYCYIDMENLPSSSSSIFSQESLDVLHPSPSGASVSPMTAFKQPSSSSSSHSCTLSHYFQLFFCPGEPVYHPLLPGSHRHPPMTLLRFEGLLIVEHLQVPHGLGP